MYGTLCNQIVVSRWWFIVVYYIKVTFFCSNYNTVMYGVSIIVRYGTYVSLMSSRRSIVCYAVARCYEPTLATCLFIQFSYTADGTKRFAD